MGPVLPTGSATALTEALDVLVQRGTITADQRSAILAEVVAAEGAERPSDAAEPPIRGRRPVSGVLIEIGLYIGAVLVLAAGFVLVAQNWQAMSLGVQIGLTAVTALAAGTVATVVGHGALPNSPRRRLSGALFVAAAASAAGATALMVDNASSDYTGLAAFAVAFAVLLGAHLLSPSAITELGMFGAGLGLIQGALEVLRPDVPEYLDRTSTFEQYAPMAIVTFAVVWALLVSRRLAHRELAVFAGMFVALIVALTSTDPDHRTLGMVVMGVLAVIGFWQFLADRLWPWLAAAIGSVTALVFWAVGGADRPAVAVLVAGLVLLGSSGLGLVAVRRHQEALTPGASPPPHG